MFRKTQMVVLAAAAGLAATTVSASAWYCHGSYQSYSSYYSPPYYQSYSSRSYENYYPQARYYPRYRMYQSAPTYSGNYAQGYYGQY